MNQSNMQSDPLKHFHERSSEWSVLYQRPQFRDRLHLFTSNVKKLLPSNASVMDYGCGTGTIAMALAKSGFRVTAVDGALGMVEQGTAAAQQAQLDNVTFTHIDPENWTPHTSYDGIACSSVIEYVPDDVGLLRKFSDALNPGGWLLVSIPSSTSWVGKLEDVVGKFKGKNRDVEFAQRRYKLKQFSAQLESMGLQTRDMISFEFPVLGQLGVKLSRIPLVGVMTLVIAQKQK